VITQDEMTRLMLQAANGNEDAYVFMRDFMILCHKVDDIIDEDTTKEFILQTFLEAVCFFTLNPFYRKFANQLFPLVINAINCYATSVEWEKSDDKNRQEMADHLRSQGMRVVEYVALICGNIERMRELSPAILTESWRTHHNSDGKRV
jgi:hypothetical protein